jgi:hypothetical protein
MKQDKYKVPSEVLEFLKENIKTSALEKLLDNQQSRQKNRQIFMRLSGKVLFTKTEIERLMGFLAGLQFNSGYFLGSQQC